MIITVSQTIYCNSTENINNYFPTRVPLYSFNSVLFDSIQKANKNDTFSVWSCSYAKYMRGTEKNFNRTPLKKDCTQYSR